MIFKQGRLGLGYYEDLGSAVTSISAEVEAMQAAVAASSSDTAAVMDGEDAPIIAALTSHRGGLNTAEARAAQFEKELAAWGKASSTLRHEAEIEEVRLTEQLKQLHDMQDDCTTAEARGAVKAVIDRLQAIGKRLLRISQAGR